MVKTDLHAHSSLQPYGQTFREKPSSLQKKKQSLWYYNPPRGLKKLLELLFGASSYSQSNFTSAGMGNVQVMNVSLYPPEIAFFENKLPDKLGNGLEDIITRFSIDRIKEIENGNYKYFTDILGQIAFMEKFHNAVSPDGKYRCIIAKNYNDIDTAIKQATTDTIVCVLNIEGGHTLDCGYPQDAIRPLTTQEKDAIINNISILKKQTFPILYLTLCHHFYNQLCGHCKSLPDFVNFVSSQDLGMNYQLNAFGEEVINMLLDPDPAKGKPIYIDIKHMSAIGRKRYFEMIFKGKINGRNTWTVPIIYSHGGPNSRGDHSLPEDFVKNEKVNPADIGLYDNEIIAIAESNGIIGLNIDQRVMASPDYLEEVKKKTLVGNKHERKMWWSSIVFENIKYITELLYENGYDPFTFVGMGTDYDGAINPVNNFLQEADMPDLAEYLKCHIENYYADPNCPIKTKRSSPGEVEN